MNRKLLSVLKLVLVLAMLGWAVRQIRAQSGYPTCSNPQDPTHYSSCMMQCGQASGACHNSCAAEYNCDLACQHGSGGSCSICENDLYDCNVSCDGVFDSCATNCYNEYCI